MIQNLSQLKRKLVAGTEFEITAHCRPEYIGEVCRVTKSGTQSFYSILPADPESKVSKANKGLGSQLFWSNAPYWTFENGICTLYSSKEHRENDIIISFRVQEAD